MMSIFSRMMTLHEERIDQLIWRIVLQLCQDAYEMKCAGRDAHFHYVMDSLKMYTKDKEVFSPLELFSIRL